MPAIHATRGSVQTSGNDRVFIASRQLWPEQVEAHIAKRIEGSSLHVCSGKSTIGDVRVDLYESSADVQCDAADMRDHFADKSFDTTIFDGPYNSTHQWLHDVYAELARIARKRLIIQAWYSMADQYQRYRKDHAFRLSESAIRAPRTYFGRVNLIQIFDFEEDTIRNLRDPRRRHGEYDTPDIYAQLAHKYLAQALGEEAGSLYDSNWWDAACGTGALTKPCPQTMTGRLFLSSQFEDQVEEAKYSAAVEAIAFPFDFVNESEESLPSEIRSALQQRGAWTFLINPPFTSSTSFRDAPILNVSTSAIGRKMAAQGMKMASHLATLQFMYRIGALVEKYHLDPLIGIFCQSAFLSHDCYAAFRDWWLEKFEFTGGFCINGREFAASAEWPLVFTTWQLRRLTKQKCKLFTLDVNVEGECVGTKTIDCVEKPLSDWVDRPANTVQVLPLTSAIKPDIKNIDRVRRMPKRALGWAAFTSSDVSHSKQCYLLSSVSSNGAGWGITEESFEKSLIALAIRCLVKPNWLNDRDVFSVPDTSLPGWKEWSHDAIIWFLGSGSNQAASFEHVTAHGRSYDIRNAFFWITPDQMMHIADLPETVREQAGQASEPHLARWLREKRFSADAVEVLANMSHAVETSVSKRNSAEPSFHLNRWDAGWYQIRHGLLWKKGAGRNAEGLVGDYRAFKLQHAKLRERLQDGLYDFGILKRPMI